MPKRMENVDGAKNASSSLKLNIILMKKERSIDIFASFLKFIYYLVS